MVDNSIVIMRHHRFRMLGFHLRFYFGVLKLASALYMFCQISEIFGKKPKSGQLLAYFWPTFVQLLGAPNFLLNAGIISVSGVFITQKIIAVKMGLFLQFSHKSNPKISKKVAKS